jgi:ApaG protein
MKSRGKAEAGFRHGNSAAGRQPFRCSVHARAEVAEARRDVAAPLPGDESRSTMSDQNPYDIAISVATRFVDEQSRPSDNRYVFAYTITIQNTGEIGAQLLSRHWIITDGNGKVEEVRGDGVVGEQPQLRPGEEYQYTSGAVLETSVGVMRGSYRLVAEDGTMFDAPIPQFTLSIPRTLH